MYLFEWLVASGAWHVLKRRHIVRRKECARLKHFSSARSATFKQSPNWSGASSRKMSISVLIGSKPERNLGALSLRLQMGVMLDFRSILRAKLREEIHFHSGGQA